MSWQAFRWAIGQKTGSPTLKAVLIAISNYADETGAGWPSQKRICEDAELSIRAVRNALGTLEERGFIRREPYMRDDGSRGSDRIQLAMPVPVSAASEGSPQ